MLGYRVYFSQTVMEELRLLKGKVEKEKRKRGEKSRLRRRVFGVRGSRPGSGVKPRAALPGVLLKVRELAEGFLTEVTTVGLGP